jgi:hypothetical protein
MGRPLRPHHTGVISHHTPPPVALALGRTRCTQTRPLCPKADRRPTTQRHRHPRTNRHTTSSGPARA